jgi:hypothetical protein
MTFMTPASPKEHCQTLQSELAALKAKLGEFDRAMDAAAASGDFALPKKLRTEAEQLAAALKEKLTPREVRELGIERQYAEQVQALEAAGILETLPSGEKGIKGIDGKAYPLPSQETVLARLKEKREVVKEKALQGFTKLVLVPFAMSVDALIAKYGARIKEHHSQGKLNATDGTALELDTNQPVYIWDKYQNADKTGELVYDPTSFTKENHGGKTKDQILSESTVTPGWRILLLEDLPDLPAENRGQTVGNRKQLEANKSPEEYLSFMGKPGTPYANEQGLTPEDWLTLAITNLETKNQVTDDYAGKGKIAYLTGAYFKTSKNVPRAYWYRGDRQARLGRLAARSPGPNLSARSAARI